MAEMSFRLYDINGKSVSPDRIISYEIRRDTDAPCDSLSLRFKCENEQEEFIRAKAYSNGRLVFSGFCDLQREENKGEYSECYIYARSDACLLVDNEAEPRTFESPSARALFNVYAEKYGFRFSMEDSICSGRYVVGKGLSEYAAINGLVKTVSGKSVRVTPDGKLINPDTQRSVTIGAECISKEVKTVNRCSAISEIDYKTADGAAYSHHIKSRSLEKKGINRSRKINISSLYDWQQELELKNMLRSAADEYFTVEMTLDGAQDIQLYDVISVEGREKELDEYYVCSVYTVLDSKGERTLIRLTKDIELEEIIYVD